VLAASVLRRTTATPQPRTITPVARARSSHTVASNVLDLLSLGDTPDLTLILERILRAARTAVSARYAALGVPDGRGGFERFITAGISEQRAAQIGELPRVHGVLGALLESGPIVLRDIREHPRFSYFPPSHPVMTDFLGVPITHRGKVLGNLFLAGRRGGGRFTAHDRHVVEVLARYAGVAIANADLYGSAQELAVAEERARVARELHDAASQRLFSLVYEARAASMRARDPADAEAFARLEQRAGETLHELRGLVLALRPKSLERDGLAVTLVAHVEALRHVHGLDISVEADADLGLPLDDEQELLRIAQEALQNAVKHGRGAAVRVILRRQRGAVVLTVRDDGPGFDPAALPRTVRSHGMTTMRQRARALGSELSVRSAPGQGSVVSVRVPLRGRRAP
jgi:signal transduction histidine kinase